MAWIAGSYRWLKNSAWQHFWLLFQIAAFFLILWLGKEGYEESWKWGDSKCQRIDWEYWYRSLQLFGLNHNGGCLCDNYHWALQAARFLAPVFLVVAVISLISGALLRFIKTQIHLFPAGRRALVLGYGPIGQALAAGLRKATGSQRVTAVAPKIDEAMIRAAANDGVALFLDDPSSGALFERVHATRVSRTYVALENDLANLDAAERYKRWMAQCGKTSDLRIFVEDEELAANLTDASTTGFMCGEGLQLYSAKLEAARELLQRARFDRIALAAGQRRAHIVVVGCGGQGVAVVNEVLLQCWRAHLDPPMVTVIDKRADDVKTKFMRRSPAIFEAKFPIGQESDPKWVPPMFFKGDMDALDVTQLSDAFRRRTTADPVTAWVFASAEDDRNLRAGLSLQTQMMRKDLPAAPVYLRVWAAHCRDADQLENRIVSLTHTFGSLQNALSVTHAFQDDPDKIAKLVHMAYDDAGKAMMTEAEAKTRTFKFYPGAWESLQSSTQDSNRRLHRHAALKLNDLGLDWRERCGFVIPSQSAQLLTRVADAEDAIDYERLQPGSGAEQKLSQSILNISRVEHDRWTVDRAIDGWRPHPEIGKKPKAEIKRDVARRLHENMTYLAGLDANTRRYDAVMLRAILSAPPTEGVSARPFRRRIAKMPEILRKDTPAILSRNHFECATEAALLMPPDSWKDIFKSLGMALPNPNNRTAIHSAFTEISAACAVQSALEAAAKGGALCRIVVAFCQPPDQYAIEFAEWLVKPAQDASGHAVKIESYWSWPAGDGAGSFPGLIDEDAAF